MMYPFMTLEDNTEIVHSEMLYDENGKEYVKVYFERPVKNGFQSAYCFLPAYNWYDIKGFEKKDIIMFSELLKSTAHLILEFSKEGGLENAAGV